MLEQTVWTNMARFEVGRTVRLTAAGLRGNDTSDAPSLLITLVVAGGLARLWARHRVPHARAAWGHALLWTVAGWLLSKPLVWFEHVNLTLPTWTLVDRLLPAAGAVVRIPQRLGVALLLGFALLVALGVDACARTVAGRAHPRLATLVRAALAVTLGTVLYVQLRARAPLTVVWRGHELDTARPQGLANRRAPSSAAGRRRTVSPRPNATRGPPVRSIDHRRPLLNGDSSNYPAGFPRAAWTWRDECPTGRARRLGARDGAPDILVHTHELKEDERARWVTLDTPALRRREGDWTHLLFEVIPQAP